MTWVLILMLQSGYPSPYAALTTVAGFTSESDCKDAGRKARGDLYSKLDYSCVVVKSGAHN